MDSGEGSSNKASSRGDRVRRVSPRRRSRRIARGARRGRLHMGHRQRSSRLGRQCRGDPRGRAAEAMASGAGFAALISGDSQTSRFHAIHNGLGVDEGSGAPFRAAYRLDLPEGGSLEVEDFGRWFAGADGRPCRAHGIVRIVSRAPAAGGSLRRRARRRALRSTRVQRAGGRAMRRCAARRRAVRDPDRRGRKPSGGQSRDGYDAGDELIAGVGRRLARSLRAGDSVLRYSGGKFAILMALGSRRSDRGGRAPPAAGGERRALCDFGGRAPRGRAARRGAGAPARPQRASAVAARGSSVRRRGRARRKGLRSTGL